MPTWDEFRTAFSRGFRDLVDLDALQQVSVALFGCGAVGSLLATILVRLSVGRLALWDFDSVDVANLGRSAYAACDVGMSKVESLTSMVKQVNPMCLVTGFEGDLLKAPDEQILGVAGGCSLAVVAADNFAVHQRLNALLWPATEAVYTYVAEHTGEIVHTRPGRPGCVRCLTNAGQRQQAGVHHDFQSLAIDMLQVALEASRVVLAIALRGKKGGERLAEYATDRSRLLVVVNTRTAMFSDALSDGLVRGTFQVDTTASWPACPICRKRKA